MGKLSAVSMPSLFSAACRCSGGLLGVDEQTEALLEAECGGFVGLQLLLEGVGHRAQVHCVELLDSLFDQHRSSSVVVVA